MPAFNANLSRAVDTIRNSPHGGSSPSAINPCWNVAGHIYGEKIEIASTGGASKVAVATMRSNGRLCLASQSRAARGELPGIAMALAHTPAAMLVASSGL